MCVLLCSFFINLEITNALNVSNCHGVMARLFNNSYEDGDVILTNDINENDGSYCEDYENGGFYQINFRENQERTIDLNGYTLNLKHRFEIYADEGTVLNIIDSSEEKTGKLIIPSIDLFPCDSESCYNVEINIDGGNYIADTLIKTYDAEYIQTFNFSNARFKGNTFANGSFDKVNIKNAIIEPKTDNITFMYNEYDFSLNEVIEKNYKVLNSGKEVELSKSISELASKDNIYVVKDNKYIYNRFQ